jgi:hypothetical protein
VPAAGAKQPTLAIVGDAGRAGMLVARVIAEAGDQTARHFLELFAATIRNKNTRVAYPRAVRAPGAHCVTT